MLIRSGRVVTRAVLTTVGTDKVSDRELDGVVRQLRSKLEALEGCRRIVAVRGVGFRITSDETPVRLGTAASPP